MVGRFKHICSAILIVSMTLSIPLYFELTDVVVVDHGGVMVVQLLKISIVHQLILIHDSIKNPYFRQTVNSLCNT